MKAMAFAAKGQFFSSSIWPVLFSRPPPFLPHPPPPDTKESERAAAAASGSEKRASIQSSGAVSSGSQKRTAFVIVVVECVCTVYCPFLLSADVLGPSIGLDRGKERAGGGCIPAVVLVLPPAEWGDFPIPRAYIRRQGSYLETLEQATKSGPLPLKAHRGLLRCPGEVTFGPQRALFGRFWEHISWSLLHTANVFPIHQAFLSNRGISFSETSSQPDAFNPLHSREAKQPWILSGSTRLPLPLSLPLSSTHIFPCSWTDPSLPPPPPPPTWLRCLLLLSAPLGFQFVSILFPPPLQLCSPLFLPRNIGAERERERAGGKYNTGGFAIQPENNNALLSSNRKGDQMDHFVQCSLLRSQKAIQIYCTGYSY